ncbi:MAG: CHASE3 domain-containing protein [Steroidobacteraceae bacterium]
MHKRLIEEGFNRRYVLLPMLLSIGLVVAGYSLTATRRTQARELTELLRERQDVMRLITETGYGAMEAESAQRGFLLTGDEKYVQPLEVGLAEAKARLADLRKGYEKLDPGQLPVVDGLGHNLDIKTQEMRQSVDLLHAGKEQEAMALLKSGLGLQQTIAITQALDSLRANERKRMAAGLEQWNRTVELNTLINTCNMVFTVSILLVLGLLATRDIRRRNIFATTLATQIDSRTSELRDLSLHMSRVAESEKHALARELHDELGGLLVAMRMDVSQIRKRLGPITDEGLLARWERIEQALAQGLALKRRVIEDLRPTLLDNMGLFTALRWLATQCSEQGQLKLEMHGLDEDIELPPETAIAIFRTAQEAMSNIVKHAGATRLEINAEVGSRMSLEISDDGRGIPNGADLRIGSHGLKQMRFRMEAVSGGSIHVRPREPRGTTVTLSVPLEPTGAEIP